VSAVPAEAFELSCRVSNLTAQADSRIFAPGDRVRVVARIRVGRKAIKQTVDVETKAKVQVLGFNLKIGLPSFTVDIPNAKQRKQIPGWDDVKDAIPKSIFLEKSKIFKLPTSLPRGRIELRVVATLNRRNSRSCKQDIEIR
jgi:hypothetical protein